MSFEQVNGKVVSASVTQGREVLARRGAMLAYTGKVGFAPVRATSGGLGGMAGRMMAGEQVAMMVAQGQGVADQRLAVAVDIRLAAANEAGASQATGGMQDHSTSSSWASWSSSSASRPDRSTVSNNGTQEAAVTRHTSPPSGTGWAGAHSTVTSGATMQRNARAGRGVRYRTNSW